MTLSNSKRHILALLTQDQTGHGLRLHLEDIPVRNLLVPVFVISSIAASARLAQPACYAWRCTRDYSTTRGEEPKEMG